jgi:glycerophosphoryl diester phosphodiesterase
MNMPHYPAMRRKVLIGFIAFALVLAGIYAVLASTSRPAANHAWFTEAAGRVAVIAHRGGAGLRPENTLAAFAHAAQIGADVLEMDLRQTADGVMVVIHDATVDRTTEGTGRVDAMAFAELRKLDAGYLWSGDGGKTFPYRGQGIRVPTLEEALAAHPDKRLVLEMKQPLPLLCAQLRAAGAAKRALVASFDDAAIRAFRTVCPEVATSLAFGEARNFVAAAVLRLAGLTSPAAPALVIPDRFRGWTLPRPEILAAARSRNVNVQVWTVNDATRMRELVRLGVDGIMTDRPDRLIKVIATPETVLSSVENARE